MTSAVKPATMNAPSSAMTQPAPEAPGPLFSPAKGKENEGKPDEATTTFDFTAMRPLFEDLGKTFAASVDGLRAEFRNEVDQLGIKLKTVETAIETTPERTHTARPAATGNGYARTDC